jgi:hypothetical protein
MKLAPIVAAAATCCCALWTVSAAAETCDQRYPGSCRLEVSTTTVKTKGDTVAVAPRSSRRIKRIRKLAAKGVRPAAVRLAAPAVSVPLPRPSPRRVATKGVRLAAATVSVPLPPPSPRRVAAAFGTKPTTVVNEAFNSLASSGSTDRALEAALISRRDQLLGFALR